MQAETLVQEVECCLDAISPHASTDELERKRDPVEPGANVRHQRRIRIIQLEATAAGSCALHQEFHRRKRLYVARFQVGVGHRALQWRQPARVLAFDPQSLAAGRQNVNRRSIEEDALGQGRCHIDQVLAVVEHQEHAC